MAKAQIQAPSIGTLVALNITQNNARLQFNINYNGSSTTYRVTYSVNSNLSAPVVQTTTGNVNTFGWQTRYFDIGGLQPNTRYYWRVTASNSLGTTNSVIESFTTLGVPTVPTLSNISVNGITPYSSTINYTVSPNHAATTSVIKYGLADNALTNQVNGITANNNTPSTGATNLPGLSPNTTYFYQIEAANSAGTTSSSIESFTTLNPPVPQLIAEYNFNSTYNNVNGNTPFTSNMGTSFVADRHGAAGRALNINDTGTNAAIPDLPYGNSARSVSVWTKLNSIKSNYNFLYSYGTAANPDGAYINPNTIIHFAPSHNSVLAHSTDIWYHFVFTYDGTASKIYRNGTLISSSNVARNTVNNSDVFRLGLSEGGALNYFNGTIDDLKIYNYALSESEVSDLYNTQTLAVTETKTKSTVVVYPNPASDIINIETKNLIKDIEIISAEGKTLLHSKEKTINISRLNKGMYFVKITDSHGNTATQKIIKK